MALTAVETPPGPRTVSILGSTGSVGCNTIDLIERNRDRFVVEALTARSNVGLLAEQARRLNARIAVIADPSLYRDLKREVSGSGVDAAAGVESVIEAAARPTDWIMAAIVGAAGLEPTMAAVRRGAIIALANKECLVCAGALMTDEIRDHGATIVPVDSEHNAIFQVFDFVRPNAVEKITLTASGGPFRTLDREAMAHVTPSQAVDHPNWDMGAKISVDSATMMNKGLELIEAYHLFPVDEDQLEVVIHPQSVVHSLVTYVDGSTLAQFGSPDMRTPIAYALSWPIRMAAPSPRLDLVKLGQLTFEAPDSKRFPALALARDALQAGGAAPTIMNAANEIAVGAFLANRIGFLDIAHTVARTMERVTCGPLRSLADVREIDTEARAVAESLLKTT